MGIGRSLVFRRFLNRRWEIPENNPVSNGVGSAPGWSLDGKLVIFFLICLYGIIVLRNAWVGDDAYITLRTGDNFIHGYGLRWNIDERVQSYTSPLWLFLMMPFMAIGGNIYFWLIGVSLALSISAVSLGAFRLAGAPWAAAVGLAVFALSDAFVDYSTSGLENPLMFFLLTLFLITYFRKPWNPSRLLTLSIISSLILLTRQDELFLIAPALLYVFWTIRGKQALRSLTLGLFPVILWELFSFFYYGFPFPNTAYAKLDLGVGKWPFIQQGFCYLLNSLFVDPLTVFAICAGCLLPFIWRDRRAIPVAVGIVGAHLYIIWIGGCFMSGRHLAAPLLVAVMIGFRYLKRMSLAGNSVVMAAVVLLGLTSQYAPVYTGVVDNTKPEDFTNANYIVDERAWYRAISGLIVYDRHATHWPKTDWVEDGIRAREERQSVVVRGAVGMFGYYAGPGVHIIDQNALTDPLLAHLATPTPDFQKPGHFVRPTPIGYLKSVEKGENLLMDSDLVRLYDHILLITRGHLFSLARLREIVKFNLGMYKGLIDAYQRPHTIYARISDINTPRPQGTAWNEGHNIILDTMGLKVALDSLCKASQIEISYDHNDEYFVSFYHAGTRLATDTIPLESTKEGGLKISIITVPPAAVASGYDRLDIYPGRGDGMYSVGHVRVLDEKVPEPAAGH